MCHLCVVKHVSLLESWTSMLMRQENVLVPSSHQDFANAGTLAADMRQKVRSRLRILYMSMGDYDALLNMGDPGTTLE